MLDRHLRTIGPYIKDGQAETAPELNSLIESWVEGWNDYTTDADLQARQVKKEVRFATMVWSGRFHIPIAGETVGRTARLPPRRGHKDGNKGR